MITKRLKRDFFEQDTVTTAKALIGKALVFDSPHGKFEGIINETEAYTQDEPACHAFRGKTPRNQTMFEEAGLFYVYFIYGMYFCANIVTESKGRGCAVLLRSVVPTKNIEKMRENRGQKQNGISNGPGKLCQAYGFNKSFDGLDICNKHSQLYIEDTQYIAESIESTCRVGISKAKEFPWRFFTKEFHKVDY